MALVLTEEQQLLRDTATQFFRNRVPLTNLRTLRDTNSADGFDRAVWKEMSDLGFAGILTSEKYGGTDFGPVGLGLVLEPAGRTLAASPLASPVLPAVSAVQPPGTAPPRHASPPALPAGDIVVPLPPSASPPHTPHPTPTNTN